MVLQLRDVRGDGPHRLADDAQPPARNGNFNQDQGCHSINRHVGNRVGFMFRDDFSTRARAPQVKTCLKRGHT